MYQKTLIATDLCCRKAAASKNYKYNCNHGISAIEGLISGVAKSDYSVQYYIYVTQWIYENWSAYS